MNKLVRARKNGNGGRIDPTCTIGVSVMWEQVNNGVKCTKGQVNNGRK